MLSRADAPDLVSRILQDYEADRGDRAQFEGAFRRWTRMYDNVVESKSFPFQDASNLNIPVISWTITALQSRLQNPLFATDGLTIVKPKPEGWSTGAVDRAKVVEQYLNWRFANRLNFFDVMDEATPKSILYGTWFVKIRPRTDKAGQYVGPEFVSASPMDVVLPNDCTDIWTAEHVIHRCWRTIDELLWLERQGVYDGVAANLEALRANLKHREEDRWGSSLLQDTRIDGGSQMGRRIWLEVLECNYRYDSNDDGLTEEWLFTVAKGARIMIRQVPLRNIYPSERRPWEQFIYKRAMRGPYGKGLAQELEDLNVEINAIFNQMTDAGTLSLAPVIVVRSQSGAAAQLRKEGRIFPGMIIETEDPERDVRVMSINPSVSFGITDVQFLLGFSEKLSAISDVQLGRAPDRPGLPRTYGQQLLLQEGGNESIALIGKRYAQTVTKLIEQVFLLDKAYMPSISFFRTTGAYKDDILGVLSAEDVAGDYDFELRPQTPARNKMLDRQQKLQALQFLLPMIDRARVDPGVYRIVKLVWETFDLQSLEEIIQFGDDPVKAEHVAILQGRPVQPSPYDDPGRHIGMHLRFAKEAEAEGRQDIQMVTQQHIQDSLAMYQQRAPANGRQPRQPAATVGEQFAAENPISRMGNIIGSTT